MVTLKHRCSEKESEIVAVKFVTVDGIHHCKIHTHQLIW